MHLLARFSTLQLTIPFSHATISIIWCSTYLKQIDVWHTPVSGFILGEGGGWNIYLSDSIKQQVKLYF